MGTEKEDYIQLTQRIGRKTGGIRTSEFASETLRTPGASSDTTAWMFIRAKALTHQVGELFDILGDVLLKTNFNQQNRFLQIVQEERARHESHLIPAGHQIVQVRLNAGISKSGWLNEQWDGVTHLFFLRQLEEECTRDWDGVLRRLIDLKDCLIIRENILGNFTQAETQWAAVEAAMNTFLDRVPSGQHAAAAWDWKHPKKPSGALPVQPGKLCG